MQRRRRLSSTAFTAGQRAMADRSYEMARADGGHVAAPLGLRPRYDGTTDAASVLDPVANKIGAVTI